MEDLICPLCRLDYDTDTRIPRLFPNCGHTFCSRCILDMIDQTEEELMCPEDQVVCQFFNKNAGLGCFPLNFALHRMIKQKQLPSPPVEQKEEEEIIEEVEEEEIIEKKEEYFCNDHNKKSELVCMTDKKLICTDCVLFGIHKNHEYVKMEEFKRDIRTKASTLDNKNETLKYKSLLLNNEQQMNSLNEKVFMKKNKLIGTIKENMDTLVEEVRMKEKELEEKLENKFNKFEHAISVIVNSSRKLKDKQQNIERVLQKIKSQIQEDDYDFNFLLNSIYSDTNVFVSLKELLDDTSQLENNASEMIDKELEKYRIDGDVGEVIKNIHNCIEVKSEEDDFLDGLSDKKVDLDMMTDELTPTRLNVTDLKDQHILLSDDSPVNSKNNINEADFAELSDLEKDDKEDSASLINIQLNNEMNSEEENPVKEEREDRRSGNISINSINKRPMKKNLSFFRRNTNVRPSNLLTSSFYPPNEEVNSQIYNPHMKNNMFLPDKFRQDISHSVYQQNHMGDIYSQNTYQRKFTQNNKLPSWNEQDSMLTNKRRINSPMRRMTTTNTRAFPASTRKIKAVNITEINFERMKINDHALSKILLEINRNKNAKVLNLNYNSITEIGFEQILKKIVNHPKLEQVHLTHNNLNDSVFNKIEKYFRKFKKVNYFNFKNSSMFKNMVRIKKSIKSLKKNGIHIDI